MSGALRKLGGGGGGRVDINPIRNVDTGLSRTFARGETSQGVRLDSSIRDLENENIDSLRGIFQRFQQLPEAVVSPFRRNLDRRRAELRRGFARRGLGGSSIADSFLQGQARQDEQEASELLGRALFDVGNAERGVVNDLRGISSERTARELSSLGVGQDIARLVIQGNIAQEQINSQNRRNAFNTGAGILGRGFSAFGGGF